MEDDYDFYYGTIQSILRLHRLRSANAPSTIVDRELEILQSRVNSLRKDVPPVDTLGICAHTIAEETLMGDPHIDDEELDLED